MNKELIEKAKKYFYKVIEETNPDVYNLTVHIPEAERWAKCIAKKYPDADEEVLLLAVWLHDISHYLAMRESYKENQDHAVLSEKMAKEFLKEEGYNPQKLEMVAHCIRSHRCKDVMPSTLEAKLFAYIDSVSHFTWNPYVEMARDGRVDEALDKLDRDFRDLNAFPEMKKEVEFLYDDHKKFLEDYQKLDY